LVKPPNAQQLLNGLHDFCCTVFKKTVTVLHGRGVLTHSLGFPRRHDWYSTPPRLGLVHHCNNGYSEVCLRLAGLVAANLQISIRPVSLPEPLLRLSTSSPRCVQSLPYDCVLTADVHPLSLPGEPSSDASSHTGKEIGQNGREKQKNVRAQGASSSTPWRRPRVLTLCGTGESCRLSTTIGMLPDNVLLEIFVFYRNNKPERKWHFLVHVCQKWRQIVFASPRRLDLQIFCTNKTRVRKNLGIWPALPLVIQYRYTGRSIRPRGEGNVVAALQHPDRVCHVHLDIKGSQLGKMAKVMKKPFPVLTRLFISSNEGNAPVLPAKFLEGSAPRLQSMSLFGIPFPALPMLLLSTSDLVNLHLDNIPPTGYISPEKIVACLAALPRLESFTIKFKLATPRPDRIHPPPVTRTVLPALTTFHFRGASEYLEDLVSRIDGPQLTVNYIYIIYLNQLVDFQVAQLRKFVDRLLGPKLTLSRCAQFDFYRGQVSFNTHRHYYHANNPYLLPPFPMTVILCEGTDCQVSHIAQVLSQFSATISTVVHLKLNVWLQKDRQLEATDDVEWQHLLHQFSAVQTLYVPQELAAHVARALEDITGEMVPDSEVLPSLDLICLTGQLESSIEKFVAARRLSGRPITVINTATETEFEERLKSYVIE
jgi:hypothetical protein